MIRTVRFLITSFSKKLIIFIALFLKDSQKFFMRYLPLYTSCLFSVSSNNDILDIEKPDGICSPTFVVGDFLGLFLHPSIFSNKD